MPPCTINMHLEPGSHHSALRQALIFAPVEHADQGSRTATKEAFLPFPRHAMPRGAPPSHATNGARAREARLLPPHVRHASGYVRLCVPVDARGIRA